ncbi:MAG: hypothetical protein ABIC19_03915 [Patescibacteria group bacterium]|nr:hypothetical protein [Patescibacteria group bacterium]
MFSGFGNPVEAITSALDKYLKVDSSSLLGTLKLVFDATEPIEMIGRIIGLIAGALFLAMASVTVLSVVIYLIIRVIALWILLVLSPFAYIGLVLPDTAKISSAWWSSFLKYALAGPIIFFFLWFSAQMTTKVLNKIENKTINPPSGDGAEKIIFTGESQQKLNNYAIWLYLFFCLALMWGAMITASNAGIYGAKAISGMAKVAVTGAGIMGWKYGLRGASRVVGTGGTLVSKGAGWVLKKSGQERFGQRVDEAGTRWSGRAGTLINTFSALEPLTLGRSIYEGYKRLSKQTADEDLETLQAVGGLIFHPIQSVKHRKRLGELAAEEFDKNYDTEEQGAKIEELKEQSEDETKTPEQRDAARQELKKINDDRKYQKAAFIRNAKAGVVDRTVERSYFRDRVRQEKIKRYQERMPGQSRAQLTRGYQTAPDSTLREAYLRKIAALGPRALDASIKEIGYAGGVYDLPRMLKKDFSPRNALLLASDLSAIGQEKNDLALGNLTTKNKITNKFEMNAPEKWVKDMIGDLGSMSPEDVPKIKAYMIQSDDPDINKQLKLFKKELVKEIDSGKLMPNQNGFKRIDQSVRDILEKEKSDLFPADYYKPAQQQFKKDEPKTRRAGFV